MLNRHSLYGSLLAVGVLMLAADASAQGGDVVIESEELAEKVHVLYGRGGNMLLFAGEERSFLVDDQLEPLSEKIQAKIAELTPRPVDFVLNTHYHGDHTGGNENFGKAGAVVFSHDHARELMTQGRYDEVFDEEDEAAKPENLPIITFSAGMHFHIDGQDIEAVHVPSAHTGGDAIVHLASLNIVHMGDVFFNGLYPFIDVSAGGRVSGVLAACETVFAASDGDTKIVPGHGRMTDRDGLRVYMDMLQQFQTKAQAALAAGQSLDDFVATKMSADYDEVWGKTWLTGDQISKIVYLSEQKDAGSLESD